jgi:hypothetical protein
MSDPLKSQIADVIEKHVGYTNGWAVSPDMYRIAAEEAAAEILTMAATKAAHPEGGPVSAGVIAWLVQGHTPARTVTLDEKAAEAYRATEGFTVTPLIAAPPAQAVEEVREILREYGTLWESYNEAGPVEMNQIDAEVEDLEARLLLLLSCAAPLDLTEETCAACGDPLSAVGCHEVPGLDGGPYHVVAPDTYAVEAPPEGGSADVRAACGGPATVSPSLG